MRLKDLIGKRIVAGSERVKYFGTLHSIHRDDGETQLVLTDAWLVTAPTVDGSRKRIYVAPPAFPVVLVPWHSARPVHGDVEVRIGNIFTKWVDNPEPVAVVHRAVPTN